MDLPVTSSVDQILLQLIPTATSRKVLFWGEGAGEISSYIAGWMVSQGVDVVVLDGANRFDPYVVSSFGKKVSISPENLLKRIRIARAFTCYQMATLVEEKLVDLLRQEEVGSQTHNPWVILLGPTTTFLDGDVPERDIGSLFERMLRKIEEMAVNGVSFFLFQPAISSGGTFPPFRKGRGPGSKRAFLSRRLFQTSDFVWRISWDEEGPKLILEKEFELNIIENCKLQNEKCKFERKSFQCLSGSG
jgi:hypothetical protein